MAGLLEATALSVPTSFPSITSSSVPSLAGRRRSVNLPAAQFRGLKAFYFTRSSSSALTFGSRVPNSRGHGIVCEAQQGTAVDVPPVTEDKWQSLVLESDLPVLVEFWAPWCGPCRMIHPVIDKLAKEYTGKLKCFKVNTDDCPSIASQYGIRSIPTVMIFKNGEKKDAVIGAVPESTLTNSIEKFLQ